MSTKWTEKAKSDIKNRSWIILDAVPSDIKFHKLNNPFTELGRIIGQLFHAWDSIDRMSETIIRLEKNNLKLKQKITRLSKRLRKQKSNKEIQ